MGIDFLDIIRNSLMITSFVIIMMSLIEYVNVWTNGKFIKSLNKNAYVQALIGALLGLIPGCMGTFTAVSLYTHKALSLGAMVGCLIATSGDEAFFMLATMPKQSLWMFLIQGVIAFIVSIIVDKLFKGKDYTSKDDIPFDVHEEFVGQERVLSFKNITWSAKRICTVVMFAIIIALCGFGIIGHSHSDNLIFSLPNANEEVVECEHHHDEEICEHHHHGEECECHEHHHEGEMHEHHHGKLDIVKIIIASLSALMILIALFSSEHFISEHIVHHVIRKHLPKVFLWTFGVLILMAVILNYTNFGDWIYNNMYIFLLIAVLIGILPESGPHLVFVVLFVQGYIPFSILLANSIVQDGHGSLPLLAETKKGFLVMKAINIVVGLVVGIIGLVFGF